MDNHDISQKKNEIKKFSGLAQYIILIGFLGTLIYIFLSYESQGTEEFLKHFLSTENHGMRFRALILFTPLIAVAVAYLINEREKYLLRLMNSEVQLHEKNEELVAFNERLSALRSIEMAISTGVDLQATLKILIDKVVSQLKIDAVDLLLMTSDTNMMVYSAGSGFLTKHVEEVKIKPGQGFAGHIAQKHSVIAIEDLDDYISKSTTRTATEIKNSPLYTAENIKTYFGIPLISDDKFLGVLEVFHRTPYSPSKDWYSFLETFAAQAAIAINKASLFNELQDSNIELVNAYDTTIEGWARALDYRDKETEGHSRRVTDMTADIAKKTDFSEEELLHVRRGALLHDIGKMGVPDRILLKQGSLDEEERKIIMRHPDIAYNLLSPITFLRPTIDIPYCHHERWDGTGYPRELKGEEIPLAARIFCIVDVWDALRSDRPYRKAWSSDKTLKYIKEQSGSHFDPKVVELFIAHIDSIESERHSETALNA
jgi:HD-GYP domain-containing protein (c-di-GMP phosphodiesterase class II)